MVPNLLSAARLAAGPYLFWLLWQRQWETALWVILLAAITDFLDGFLARRWHVESRLGEVLDPIADKVLLSGAFLALWMAGAVENWLTALVLGRDVLILLVGITLTILFQRERRFPASVLGKISTAVQIAFVVAVVAQAPDLIAAPLKWATAVLTAGSGIDYARRAAYNVK